MKAREKMRVLTKEEMQAIAEDLVGTPQSIESAFQNVIEDEDVDLFRDVVNDKELYETIDNVTFECVECGWWCEAGDYADYQPDPTNGDVCTDCGGSKDE